MYTSDIRYADLKSTNTAPIKGTRRHVLYSDHKYGIEVGDFNSKVRFGFVVHKPSQYAGFQIRVELKVLVPVREDNGAWRLGDIDPNYIQDLLDKLDDEKDPIKYTYVIENGHGYFKGYYLRGTPRGIPQDLQCSNAASFLNIWGDALATAMYAKDKVSTLQDAYEVNDLLISVDAFTQEMKDKPDWGTASHSIEAAQHNYEKSKCDLEKVEQEMNFFYKQLDDYLQVLEKYGVSEDNIDYK